MELDMEGKFTVWSAGIKGCVVAVVVFATPALASDCGQGTYLTDAVHFFSDEFAGSLAIAPQARSVQEAKKCRNLLRLAVKCSASEAPI